MQASHPLITLLVSILAGLLSGGVGGAFVSYFLRRRGSVRCIVPKFNLSYVPRPEHEYDAVDVSFTLRLYNEREVGTSVGHIALNLQDKSGGHLSTATLQEQGANKPIMFLDLPPQASVWRKIAYRMDVPKNSQAEIAQGESAVRWRYPDGKLERQIVPTLGFEGSGGEPLLSRVKAALSK
jgi:hypothetical protein